MMQRDVGGGCEQFSVIGAACEHFLDISIGDTGLAVFAVLAGRYDLVWIVGVEREQPGEAHIREVEAVVIALENLERVAVEKNDMGPAVIR